MTRKELNEWLSQRYDAEILDVSKSYYDGLCYEFSLYHKDVQCDIQQNSDNTFYIDVWIGKHPEHINETMLQRHSRQNIENILDRYLPRKTEEQMRLF